MLRARLCDSSRSYLKEVSKSYWLSLYMGCMRALASVRVCIYISLYVSLHLKDTYMLTVRGRPSPQR